MKIPKWLRPDLKSQRTDFHDVLDESKTYLLAQTVQPVKDLARTLVFGIAGSLLVGVGFILGLIALLRALQTETGTFFSGTFTFGPYLAVFASGTFVAAVVVFMGVRRYRKRVNI